MRRLALRRETLAPLTPADLASVVGALSDPIYLGETVVCLITHPCISPAPDSDLECALTGGCA